MISPDPGLSSPGDSRCAWSPGHPHFLTHDICLSVPSCSSLSHVSALGFYLAYRSCVSQGQCDPFWFFKLCASSSMFILHLGWLVAALGQEGNAAYLAPCGRFSKASRDFCFSKSSFRTLWAFWLHIGSCVPRLVGIPRSCSVDRNHFFVPSLFLPA